MADSKDYYEILGVPRDADTDTIRRAFRRKAATLHPDVNKAPDAEEKFKEVNEAYAVLSDEQKRANYDRYGTPDGPAGFGGGYGDVSDIFGGGGFGIDDIFDTFFGGGGRGGQSARRARTRGRDMGIRLTVSLEEAAAGATKTLRYDRLATCETCGGSGTADGGGVKTCPRCHGSGRVVEVRRTVLGQMQTESECPQCHGTGQVVDKPCPDCHGEGRRRVHEEVQVNVPAGVSSGWTTTLGGKGEAGLRGDATGDLVVSVEVEQHERFERRGDDLYCRVTVDALAAIVGTTVSVRGILDGETVAVPIPAGCQFGQEVRVERRGMPHMGRIGRGDLVALVEVTVPTDLTQKQLLEVAGIVAERSLDGDAPADASDDVKAGGASTGKDEAAEHFAGEGWVPKNPFKDAGRKKPTRGTGRSNKGRRR